MLDTVDLIDGNEGGSSKEGLYNLLRRCLEYHKILSHNLMGLTADGASDIMGTINSLARRLR